MYRLTWSVVKQPLSLTFFGEATRDAIVAVATVKPPAIRRFARVVLCKSRSRDLQLRVWLARHRDTDRAGISALISTCSYLSFCLIRYDEPTDIRYTQLRLRRNL